MTLVIDLNKPSIIVPSNEMAMEKLYKGDLNDLECTFFSFNRDVLYQIFSTGFFDHLNMKYDLFISDYEHEDIIEKEKLKAILSEDIKQFRSSKHFDFWDNFESCVIASIEKGTGLFFLF